MRRFALITAGLAGFLAANIGLFVLFNSGVVGGEACSPSVDDAPLSWWPPGAQCLGPDDDPVQVHFNWAFLLLWPSIYAVTFTVRTLRTPRPA